MSDGHGAPQSPGDDQAGSSPAPAVAPGGKKKRSRGKRILLWTLGVLGVLVVAFVVLVAVGVHQSVQQDNAAQPGQCVNLGTGTALAVSVVKCTAPSASYLVAARSPSTPGTCPTGDYFKYVQTGRFGGDFTLCLAYNWKADDCFADNLKASTSAQRIECSLGPGPDRYKVAQVLTGPAEKAGCASGDFEVTYTQPAEIICFKNL